MKRKYLKHQLFYFLSLNFLDHHLEKIFIKNLHKRKQKYIDKTILKFQKFHPDANTSQINELNEKLIVEANRVYDIVDKSLLRAGIKRAKYTFLVTAIISIIIMGILIAVTHGGAALALPLITPVLTWAISISTIPISYNERIKGGLDAVLHAYEASLLDDDKNNYLDTECAHFKSEVRSMFATTKEPSFETTIKKNDDSTKILLQTLRDKIDELLCEQVKAPDECSKLDIISSSSNSSFFENHPRIVDAMFSEENMNKISIKSGGTRL